MWQRGAFSVQTSHYSPIEELEGHPNIAGRLSGSGEHAAHTLPARGSATCMPGRGTRPSTSVRARHVLHPRPQPSFSGTYDGRDGSSALLQLLQVQRLLRRGVQPGLAGGVEQAGPGGQQPEHKTGVKGAMPRTSSTSDRSPTSHTPLLRAAELGRPQAPEHTVHLGS